MRKSNGTLMRGLFSWEASRKAKGQGEEAGPGALEDLAAFSRHLEEGAEEGGLFKRGIESVSDKELIKTLNRNFVRKM